ncbi:hypothetical protein IPA_07680 [Ignicoccus pacificus DSM 13166]|uniref:Uncharacterized protein n=1 Tax=Ignicoccus pacificus DSM 13166 TaxID=940294 RepID=A0A977KCU2_9CREN|nr:hypothetical protein IPA_07680 [Ignicoccus pacificus DSM 13166]
MSAIKVGRPYKEVLEQMLRDLERRGIKLTQKELIERLILAAANEERWLESVIWKSLSFEEAEALLDDLEVDLGVEDTKSDMVRRLYSGTD